MFKPEKQNSPIFVTGVERSGNSIVARIISSCGAYTGRASEMMENDQLRHLVSSYYELLGVDKKGQYPLPNIKKLTILTDWDKMVYARLGLEMIKIKPNQSWMFKSSKIGQTWPLWNNAFPTAKWIIVRRKPVDIINSCLRTGYMTAYQDREGWLEWIHIHEKLFVGMIEAGLNCKQVWPERMVTGDYRQMIEMVEWLGLTWNDSIPLIIDPLLWKSKQQEKKGV
jgi:hypothetical protein